MRDETNAARIERALATLEALLVAYAAKLDEYDDLAEEPETDPEAVAAAEKMVSKRRFEILKAAGLENGSGHEEEE